MDFELIPMKPVPPPTEVGDLPYVTHEGAMIIGDKTLRVYQLSSGQRVVNGEDMEAFFERAINFSSLTHPTTSTQACPKE